jgi:transcription initiation factor TFIIIB Brf1 subunit/transcription initiation factor TFIIB
MKENVNGKPISSLTLSRIKEKDERQRRSEVMELSSTNFDVCSTYNDSKAIIFDAETNETLCSSCGIVLRDNVQSASPRGYSQHEIESRNRTGMPTSRCTSSSKTCFTASREESQNDIWVKQKMKLESLRKKQRDSSLNKKELPPGHFM